MRLGSGRRQYRNKATSSLGESPFPQIFKNATIEESQQKVYQDNQDATIVEDPTPDSTVHKPAQLTVNESMESNEYQDKK